MSEALDVRRFTDVSCPAVVPLHAPRAHVIVRLSPELSRASISSHSVMLRRDQRVKVLLHAPGFELLNAPEQELDPRHPIDSVVFDLRPLRPCSTKLQIAIVQHGDILGVVSLPLEIGERPVNPAHALPSTPTRPDLLLQVDAVGRQMLRYRLVGADGVARDFGRVEAPVALKREIRRVYKHLARLTLSQTDAARQRGKPVISAEEVETRVRNLGGVLWQKLIPRDLKAYYEEHRAQWEEHPPSLLIVSDDPDIPWELVWPNPTHDADSEVPWCERFCLARWLSTPDLDPQVAVPPTRLAMPDFAQVIPSDLQMPEIEEERRFLSSMVTGHRLRDASPAAATWQALTSWLNSNGAEAGCDWLHVTAHSDFSPKSPTLDSGIDLEGKGRFSPPDITCAAEVTLRRRRPGWMFNGCQAGRCSDGLTRAGGWAGRLIEAGVGVFVAPLWTVRTETAARFSRGFYPRLLEGQRLARAVREARVEARQQGDPSWMAYTLYGHPEARVQVGSKDLAAS